MKKTLCCTRKFIMKGVICMMVLSCLLGVFSPITACAAENENQKVRVGFFGRNGYHMMSEFGTRSGYGYEVLQLMARYSDLCYEYVGYENTRGEVFKMLDSGEIDLITSAHESSKSFEKYSFSEVDIGTCSTMLTVRAGNLDIQAGKYETYDGVKVGIMKDNIHDVCFHEFAEENGFSYNLVYYGSIEEVVEGLKNGEVDIAATASIRVLDMDEWYLESFHEEPTYIIVKKGNEELLERVNEALKKMDLNEPDWRLRLMEKYYPKDMGELLNLSAEEREYLAELQEEGKVFRVLVNPNRYPYSYLEDGQFKGIMVDLFANLAGKAGIDYEYIMVENRKEYQDMLISDEVDICIDSPDDFSTAENYGYRITDVYLQVNYSWLTRSDHTGVITKGARLSYAFVNESVKNNFGDIEYVDYMFDEDAIEAVRRGDVEGYSTNTLHAEQVIWEDELNELQTTVRGDTLDFTIGTAIPLDDRLLSILNKAVNNMDESLLEEVKAEYSYLGERPFSWRRLFSEYPWFPALVIVVVVLSIFFLGYVILQSKYRERILKEMDAANKANQAKAEFISRMSHDIRTPINGIVGMIEVARRNINDKEKVMDCLVKMFVSSKHLGNLVDDVLNVSQIDAKIQECKHEPFNLEEQLEYCLDIMNGKMYERRLSFEYDSRIEHPHLIGADLFLNEILINVLSNCVKYTKDGGTIRFRVEETESSDKQKAAFCFIAEDSGIGMSKEFLERIYEPFAQESVSSRTNYEGTGLGMTIVKSLLEKMGGRMEVESQLGVGSKFTIYLEFEIDHTVKVAETPSHEEKAGKTLETVGKTEKTAETAPKTVPKMEAAPKAEENADDLSGINVLVVDDIDLNIEIVQCILEDEGATVLTAYNGQEAVDIFAESELGSIHFILMDIRMPVMDGIEATKAIRALDRPDAKNVKIVAMSANSFETDAEKSIEAGMNAHMNKPVDVIALISAVAECKK